MCVGGGEVLETTDHLNQRLAYNYDFTMYKSFPKMECLFIEIMNYGIHRQPTNARPPRHPEVDPTIVINYSQWQL
jgi:hypothetical protein